MRRFLTSLVALLIIGTFSVQAQYGERAKLRAEYKQKMEQRQERGFHKRGPEARLAKLNLSDEQKEDVKQIMLNTRKEVLPLQNELREKHARLRTLSSGDTYDVSAMNKVVDEMSELRASIQKKHIVSKGEIRELLNDEQKIMFDSMPDMKKRAMKKRGLGKKR